MPTPIFSNDLLRTVANVPAGKPITLVVNGKRVALADVMYGSDGTLYLFGEHNDTDTAHDPAGR